MINIIMIFSILVIDNIYAIIKIIIYKLLKFNYFLCFPSF